MCGTRKSTSRCFRPASSGPSIDECQVAQGGFPNPPSLIGFTLGGLGSPPYMTISDRQTSRSGSRLTWMPCAFDRALDEPGRRACNDIGRTGDCSRLTRSQLWTSEAFASGGGLTYCTNPENQPDVATFTQKQGEYLAFIYWYTRVNRRAPAQADIQHYFQATPPSVHNMVVKLHEAGLIERSPGEPRSIKVLISPDELPHDW